MNTSPMTMRERWNEWKRCWRENDVPRCPECNGTGKPRDFASATQVYWQGLLHWACARCNGSGRV